MPDYSKLQYYSGANLFKNTGVFATSLTFSGTIAAGTEKVVTTTVTLLENQVFAFATAQYTELTKAFFIGANPQWQTIPTFDCYIPTTTGDLGAYIVTVINGTSVTFKGGIFNPHPGVETITATTVNISYTTYTLQK